MMKSKSSLRKTINLQQLLANCPWEASLDPSLEVQCEWEHIVRYLRDFDLILTTD